MFTSVSHCAEPISQPCQLKVTGQGRGFEPWILCRLHISYTQGRIFFKLWSYVCLSETMCRTHNSTMLTQSHSSGSQVWTLNFVSALYLCISYTSGRIFFKLWSNVHLSETCAESITQPCILQGQGHGFELWISCPICISFIPGRINFGQMDTSVGQFAEPIAQPCRLKVKVTVEAQEFEPWIWCRLHISFTPGRIY